MLALGSHVPAVWGVRLTTLALAGLLSIAGLLVGTVNGWPIWVTGVAALVPWVPLFGVQTARTYQRYQWLALFYALVVTQTAHFFEHVAQMVQIHVLGLSGLAARGVFGALDIEVVHFVWNTSVLVAIFALLAVYRSNAWLWLVAALAGWHAIEHTFIFVVYLTTGVSGTPGLLSQGGVLAGGLPVSRANLHFAYNLIETAPLLVAFLVQVRRTAVWGRTTTSAASASPAAQ